MKLLDLLLTEDKNSGRGMATLINLLQAKRVEMPDVMAPLFSHFGQSPRKGGEPFLYSFMKKCDWYEVPSDPNIKQRVPSWGGTAAVAPWNGRIVFLYDVDFLKSVASDVSHLIFLIAHEAGHIIRFSHDRASAQNYDGEVFNWASDIAINYNIEKTGKIGDFPSFQEYKKKYLSLDNDMIKDYVASKKTELGDSWENAIIADNLYRHMLERAKKNQKEKSDELAVGDVVRVKGENKYGVVTKVSKSGKVTIKPTGTLKETKAFLKNSAQGGSI